MLKERTVAIPLEGRDKGKVFKITEMPALQAERWAFRVFQALARTGAELPDGIREAGMAGLAVVGLKALGQIQTEEAFLLMDEMMSCVRIVRDKSIPDMVFPLLETDIEEIPTLAYLRMEVFELHSNFSLAGAKQKLISALAPKSADS